MHRVPLFLTLFLLMSLTGCRRGLSAVPPIPPGYEGKSFAELESIYDNLHFQYIVDCGGSTQAKMHPALCGEEEEAMNPLGNYLVSVALGRPILQMK